MTFWAQSVPPHLAVFGDTGAGKSVLSKQLFYELDRVAVYIDPLDTVDGEAPRAETVQGVRGLLADGHTRVVFKPHWDDDKAMEQVEQLINYIFRLAEATDLAFLVVTDECHNYAPKGMNSSPIVRVHKEGRGLNIKGVSISQEPMMVHHSVLRQSYHLWGGGVNEYARDYLEGYNLPIEEIKQNGEHDFLVMDKNMQPIDRVRAKEKYVS